MRTWRSVLLAALLCGLVLIGSAAAPRASAATGTTWTVLVGAEAEQEQTEFGPIGAWQFNKFYPDTITVNVGDTIVFKEAAHEAHNVYFAGADGKFPGFTIVQPQQAGPPRIFENSVLLLPTTTGPNYDGTTAWGSGLFGAGPNAPTSGSITFTKAGTFAFVCSVHAQQDPKTGQIGGMIGKVVVQPAGTAYPKTQAQIDADAGAAIAADTKTVAADDAAAKKVTVTTNADGSKHYTLSAGYMDMNVMADYMRFSTPNLSVNVGDSVTWNLMGFHNVAFYSGGTEDDFVLVEPQQGGPPKFEVNPKVLLPAGGKVYNGQGYFNSGLATGAPGAPTSYTLTFSTPGTYEYICTVHDQLGMAAHITVNAAQVAPTPTTAPQPTPTMTMPGLPDTGAAQSDGGIGGGNIGLLLVAAVICAGGVALLIKRATAK